MGIFGKKQPERLFDPLKVDAVALSGDGQTVELFIAQDAPWTGSDAQIQSLQEKVNSYVSYAVDGGMASDYPETAGLAWHIVVHAQTGPPDDRTATVLQSLPDRLQPYGGSLETRLGSAK
jgi:hypothetical protein